MFTSLSKLPSKLFKVARNFVIRLSYLGEEYTKLVIKWCLTVFLAGIIFLLANKLVKDLSPFKSPIRRSAYVISCAVGRWIDFVLLFTSLDEQSQTEAMITVTVHRVRTSPCCVECRIRSHSSWGNSARGRRPRFWRCWQRQRWARARVGAGNVCLRWIYTVQHHVPGGSKRALRNFV